MFGLHYIQKLKEERIKGFSNFRLVCPKKPLTNGELIFEVQLAIRKFRERRRHVTTCFTHDKKTKLIRLWQL